jgi:signal peptidase II
LSFSRRGLWLSLALGLAAFAADRAHKYLQVEQMQWPVGYTRPLLPFIDLTLVFNTGVSYGLLGSLPVWMVGIVVFAALCALIVWWARSHSPLVRIGLAICIGGAVSNALDRLIYPGVADFFWLHFGDVSLFVFNLADAAITLGVCLLLLDLLGIGRTRAPNPV